jgi:hypothetical protein
MRYRFCKTVPMANGCVIASHSHEGAFDFRIHYAGNPRKVPTRHAGPGMFLPLSTSPRDNTVHNPQGRLVPLCSAHFSLRGHCTIGSCSLPDGNKSLS